MQKFGLQKNSSSAYRTIELELVKEQASSLGRAGKKLRLSLERYQKNQGSDSNENTSVASDVLEISNNVWELMLQRELLGFTESNLQWVLSNYLIPQPALDRLGLNSC